MLRPRSLMNQLRYLLTPALTAVAVLLTNVVAFAQEASGTPGRRTLMDLFNTTGPVGYMIVGCSVAGLALISDKATVEPLKMEVLRTEASDHLPLVAELRLK